jgi:membrane dipeptidase
VYTLAAPFLQKGRFRLFGATLPEYSSRAIELVQASIVIDMLGLVTLDYPRLFTWQTGDQPFPDREDERLRDSGVNVIHPGVGFVDGDVYRSSWQDLSRWNTFLARFPHRFLRIDTPADIERARASNRIGVILGLQNSSHFRTLEDVDSFLAMGQRISQLTYLDNALGGGSETPARGLSDYGARVVARMNQVGMAIDVSHCSDRTTLDAIELSRSPVLATHSNCRALVPGSARCKTDEAIRKLAARGGVLGLTMVRYFVRSNGPTTIEHFLDHIDHIASVAGVECVGLGTDVDLDGRDRFGGRKQDLDGVRYSQKIFDVAEGLVRRKYSSADIALILGGNFRRVLGEIWKTPDPALPAATANPAALRK